MSPRARVDDVRALASALALGSVAGLVLGAAYLAGAKPLASTAAQTHQAALDMRRTPTKSASPAVVPAQMVKSADAGATLELRGRFHVAPALARVVIHPFRFSAVAASQTDETCLAEAVYFEARGEPEAGQQAVAQVVLNRVRHPAFPKTVCGVVHQRTQANCQFAFACSNARTPTSGAAWRRSEEVALAALHGSVMQAVGDATHFQSARGGPFSGLLKVAQVGAHVFYRFGGRQGAAAMFRQTPAVSAPPVQIARIEPKAPAPARVEAVYSMASASPAPAAGAPSRLDAATVRGNAQAAAKPAVVLAPASPPPTAAVAPSERVDVAASRAASPPAAKPVVTVALAS